MPPNSSPHRPPLETHREDAPHPSLGQGSPYSQDLRELVMATNQLAVVPFPAQVKLFIEELRLNRVYPSRSTVRRWTRQNQQLGHIRACRRSGNSFASRFRGQDLIYLALYRVAYPKASHAEINAFLHNMNFLDPTFQFYSHSQISKAGQRIGLSRKKCATVHHHNNHSSSRKTSVALLD